ncbi:MAG: hypothetical protein ILNGONEN_01053 [Syntrophorhabdaceae bacterium]|nr:hypothetical protein [Syntrophorhabdaceae bacterium]
MAQIEIALITLINKSDLLIGTPRKMHDVRLAQTAISNSFWPAKCARLDLRGRLHLRTAPISSSCEKLLPSQYFILVVERLLQSKGEIDGSFQSIQIIVASQLAMNFRSLESGNQTVTMSPCL